jgi:flavin reductase (DIM6/NTAB) family NADH-FMN oxidoreductase RutF
VVREEAYAGGDLHRIYFGEIVAAYADEDAAERLRPQ